MREENVKVNFFVNFCPNDTLDGEFFAISVLKSQVTPCPFLGLFLSYTHSMCTTHITLYPIDIYV